MDKCIHPSCTCKAYKEPKGSKGTLLQLKTGCQSCSHQASLHRKLTSVDHYIQDELKRAKKVACRHLIPAHEIPRSPLFELHDLIPLPGDDQHTGLNQEGGVQCTCKGFDFDLVHLWQKFRTHNMDYVNTELPKSICNFCRHPLAEHLASESTTDSTKPPTQFEHSRLTSLKSVYGQLSLKASASIAISVGTALSLQQPTSIEECKKMTSVALHKVEDTKELELFIVTHRFGPLEANSVSDVTSPCEGGLETDCVLPNDGAPQETSSVQSTPANRKSHATKRATKRHKLSENVPHENKRRSLRIAERERRENERALEQEKRQKEKGNRSKSSKLEAFLEARNFSESEIEEKALIKPLSEAEVKYLSDNAVEFVQSLSKEENFSSCGKLPKAISSDSHVILSTHLVEIWPNCDDPSLSNTFPLSPPPSSCPPLSIILVAVASEDGRDVCAAPLWSGDEQTTQSLVWTPLSLIGSPSTKITCLSWMDHAEERSVSEAVIAFLSIGCSDGILSVWRFKLNRDPPMLNVFEEGHCLLSMEDSKDQITACAWSPDKKYLAAGTIVGDILFYGVGLEAAASQADQPTSTKSTALKHIQTVHVCGGSVRCLAWSKDSRLVAVGGSDDCVQILQRKEPKVSSTTRPITPASILNYFERDDTEIRHKFTHTHCLKGHQSFIADVCFLANSHCLLSIGWDSQLLIWNRLLLPSLPKTHLSSSSHKTTHKEQSSVTLPQTEVEPVEGFKLGPSATVDFLPLAICNFLDCGLFVVLRNRMGLVYVIFYARL